jgi:hypothetical protein
MALGANRLNVIRMILGASIALVAVGLVLGLGTAYWLGRLVATFLFGLAPTDALTIAAAIVLIASVSALGGYLPARRAALVDPNVVPMNTDEYRRHERRQAIPVRPAPGGFFRHADGDCRRELEGDLQMRTRMLNVDTGRERLRALLDRSVRFRVRCEIGGRVYVSPTSALNSASF